MRAVAADLREQAAFCERMGTPLYGALMRHAADDFYSGGATRTLYDTHPELARYDHEGIRLCGALHRCALDGSAPELAAHLPSCGGDGDSARAWSAARSIIATRTDEIARYYAQTPQTNEVARSMLLMAGAHAIAAAFDLPLHLHEVAASAGLNTRFDAYRYCGQGWSWGRAGAPLELRNRTRSGMPKLHASLQVVRRRACDLNPLDIANPADRIVLLSFLWADQIERFERIQAAIAAASAVPLHIDRADMFEWIDTIAPQPGAVTVLMHSVVVEHLDAQAQERLADKTHALLARATADAPVAWLRMERSHRSYETRVTLAPGNRDMLIALSDGHGQDIEWQ